MHRTDDRHILAAWATQEAEPMSETFKEALRELYREADCPSTNKLSVASGVPSSTVHSAIKSRFMPTWKTAEPLIKALGGDPEPYRKLWEQDTEEKRINTAMRMRTPADPAALVDVLQDIAETLHEIRDALKEQRGRSSTGEIHPRYRGTMDPTSVMRSD